MARSKGPTMQVQHDKHTVQSIYVLSNKTDYLIRPDDQTKVCGPRIVVVQKSGTELKVFVYKLTDVGVWGWLEKLARAGAWALASKAVAPHLPDELVGISPRFHGTTQEQRERMADKLPEKPKAKSKTDK